MNLQRLFVCMDLNLKRDSAHLLVCLVDSGLITNLRSILIGVQDCLLLQACGKISEGLAVFEDRVLLDRFNDVTIQRCSNIDALAQAFEHFSLDLEHESVHLKQLVFTLIILR